MLTNSAGLIRKRLEHLHRREPVGCFPRTFSIERREIGDCDFGRVAAGGYLIARAGDEGEGAPICELGEQPSSRHSST